jgi:hypothetical protein
MEMYSSQSRARVLHLRSKFSSTRKGEMTCVVYFALMKGYADEMAATGKKIDEDDIVSYIISGLDADYNPMVEAICVKAEPTSLSDLYANMLSTESRLEAQNTPSYVTANFSNRGARSGGRSGRARERGRGRGGRNSFSQVQCQLCGRNGHVVQKCWKRFNKNFTGEEKIVNAAANYNSYGIDTNWYTDTGAADHITGELDKLTTRKKYQGQEQVHVTNGAGMSISHIGHTSFRTSLRTVHLNNILYSSQAKKNLISVHRLTKENRVK